LSISLVTMHNGVFCGWESIGQIRPARVPVLPLGPVTGSLCEFAHDAGKGRCCSAGGLAPGVGQERAVTWSVA
jgi:hypothetical protein